MKVQAGPTAFGHLLKRHRAARSLTQEALAERAGVSVRAISDLERGINLTPRDDTLHLLIDALHLPIADQAALAATARRLGESTFALLHGWSPAPPGHALRDAGPPPLGGRRHELALLGRHLAGEGPCVLLLIGEPSAGKTYLLQGIAQGAVGYGLRVLEGGCHPCGEEPFAPILPALVAYIHAQPSEQLRTDLRGCAWLVRLVPELASYGIESLPSWTIAPEHERRLVDDH